MGKLIRCELAYYGNHKTHNEVIRAYQKDRWGTLDGRSAALELSAMPESNTKSWNYSNLTSQEFLKSRANYNRFLSDVRVPYIAETITEFQPKHVIMYGRSYSKFWDAIADRASDANTTYIVLPHPTSHGVRNLNTRIWDDH